jgi:hypothetical protein
MKESIQQGTTRMHCMQPLKAQNVAFTTAKHSTNLVHDSEILLHSVLDIAHNMATPLESCVSGYRNISSASKALP